MQADPTVAAYVETCLEAGKITQASQARDRRARLGIGGEIEVLALVRHLLERDRHMPGQGCGFLSFTHSRRSPDLGRPPCPRSRHLPTGRRVARPPRAYNAPAAPLSSRHHPHLTYCVP